VTGSTATPLVYSGAAAGSCSSHLELAPGYGYWSAYNDGTGTEVPATGTAAGVVGGRGGASDCAMHTTGTGFTNWGGGVSANLNAVPGQACVFDASAFSGVRVWVKGTSTGSQGDAFAPKNNVVRVNLVTTDTRSAAEPGGACMPDSGAGQCSDHRGQYCPLSADWTQCDVPFATLNQRGFGAVSPFNPSHLLAINFEDELATSSASTLSWDVWVDDITFY
jgi:hypothetical protein